MLSVLPLPLDAGGHLWLCLVKGTDDHRPDELQGERKNHSILMHYNTLENVFIKHGSGSLKEFLIEVLFRIIEG